MSNQDLIARAREFVKYPNIHFHYKDGAEVMAALADALEAEDAHFEHMVKAVEALEGIGPSVTHDPHGDRKRLNTGVALALQFLRLTASTEQAADPAAAEATSHASELAGYILTDDMEVEGVRVRSYRKLG